MPRCPAGATVARRTARTGHRKKGHQPASKWVSDLMYFRLGKRWACLTAVIDLADRAVLGWVVSDNMTAQQTSIAAFEQAVGQRRPQAELIFHSDRGGTVCLWGVPPAARTMELSAKYVAKGQLLG